MVEIRLTRIGKRYIRHQILDQLDWTIAAGSQVVLTGPNGSGKSTLLRLISGQTEPSSGSVKWFKDGKPIPPATWYLSLMWCAPYIGFYQDLTVMENIVLHQRLRTLDTDIPSLLHLMQLESARNKPLRQLSSGMQARFKAYLAMATAADVYLFDEVTAMMDEAQAQRFLAHLREKSTGKTLIFATNDPREFSLFPLQKALQ